MQLCSRPDIYSNVVIGLMKLSEIADVRMGYPFRSRLEHDPNGDIPVVQMKDIDDSDLVRLDGLVRISLPALKEHHLIRTGDLIFRSRGRTNSVALVAADLGRTIVAAPMLLIRPRKVLPGYLHWFINLPATQAALAALAEGTSVRMVSKDAIADLDVPVPSMSGQQRVVEVAALARLEQTLVSELAARRKLLTDGILMRYAIRGSK